MLQLQGVRVSLTSLLSRSTLLSPTAMVPNAALTLLRRMPTAVAGETLVPLPLRAVAGTMPTLAPTVPTAIHLATGRPVMLHLLTTTGVVPMPVLTGRVLLPVTRSGHVQHPGLGRSDVAALLKRGK